jgi:integrase
MALTVKQVERIKDKGRYRDARGLYLQVRDGGSKSWLLRFERDGRERAMGLGSAADYTLDEARERARLARQRLNEGIDPIDARNAERARQRVESAKATAATITFMDCTKEFHRTHGSKWTSAKHARQFLTTLESYAFPVFGKLPVAAVDQALVLRALDKIWARIPSTADRVRNRIEAVLHFAKARGYREGDNPASLDIVKHALPARTAHKVEHHAALAYAKVGDFVADLRMKESVTARALEFLILTATRTKETRLALWPEIDFKSKVWAIPAARMKGGKEHKVPLSDRAIEILKSLAREDGNSHVFIGAKQGGALGHNAIDTLLKSMRNNCTVHGMRSTFRDWAGEETTFANHVVEMALAHSIDSAVEAAYRRGELMAKRRELMDAWAAYCGPAAGGNVMPLGKPHAA